MYLPFHPQSERDAACAARDAAEENKSKLVKDSKQLSIAMKHIAEYNPNQLALPEWKKEQEEKNQRLAVLEEELARAAEASVAEAPTAEAAAESTTKARGDGSVARIRMIVRRRGV